MNTSKAQFNGREEYLAWRKQWRTDYAALSNEIRDVKFGKWFSNACQPTTDAQKARFQHLHKHYANQYGWWPQATLLKLKEKARLMLETRKESKVEAQRQYLAAKEAKVAA